MVILQLPHKHDALINIMLGHDPTWWGVVNKLRERLNKDRRLCLRGFVYCSCLDNSGFWVMVLVKCLELNNREAKPYILV